ncbi:hypothetical protein GCM10027590_58230 [Nocardiopsis nanhaiensis]
MIGAGFIGDPSQQRTGWRCSTTASGAAPDLLTGVAGSVRADRTLAASPQGMITKRAEIERSAH